MISEGQLGDSHIFTQGKGRTGKGGWETKKAIVKEEEIAEGVLHKDPWG